VADVSAGSSWRLLVHEQDPDQPPGWSKMANHVVPVASGREHGQHSREHVIPGDFDELVVGSWLHVEEMGTSDDDGEPVTDGSSRWWMSVAGAVLWVDVDPGGRPTGLAYHRPGEYDDPVPGVVYTTGEEADHG
jgi:hypothetical protein